MSSDEGILRVAHETDLIEPVPGERPEGCPSGRWEENIRMEIDRRERIIRGLRLEIDRLERLLEQQ